MKKIVIMAFAFALTAFIPCSAGVGVNEDINNIQSLRAEGAAIRNKGNSCHPELVSGSCTSQNSKILNKFQNDRIFANIKGKPTGFAAGVNDIDPNNIGDTLTGTNHVTYSSSDPGDATGHVDITNPDGTTQTIYYKYTKPNDYEVTNERINNTLNSENANKKLFQNITSTSNGGAIYNNQNLQDVDITSDFIGNKGHGGGGLYNTGTISSIRSDFINNVCTWGGSSIQNNQGTIKYVVGDFVYNTSYSAAIYNITSVINTLNGNFINNISTKEGSAILNWKIINLIQVNCICNNSGDSGGAIYNGGIIDGIVNSMFYYNTAKSNSNTSKGGTIYNSHTIGTFDNDGHLTDGIANSKFYGNYAKSVSGTAQGGAIWNSGTVKVSDSAFIGNYAESESGASQGGAIYNESVLVTAKERFISAMNTADNPETAYTSIEDVMSGKGVTTYEELYESVKGSEYSGETALTETTLIKELGYTDKGGFTVESSAFNSNSAKNGGAIYNTGTMTITESNFVNNTATAYGGAIHNTGTITELSGVFEGNSAFSINSKVEGGAIWIGANGRINNITGKFSNNYASGNASVTYSNSYGGAIMADTGASVGTINAQFEKNKVITTKSCAFGGAIANYNANIDNIESIFIGNYVYSSEYKSEGGAIWVGNGGTVNSVTSKFVNNYAIGHENILGRNSYGGAIMLDTGAVILIIKSDFEGNYVLSNISNSYGGAIAVYSATTQFENSNFINNYAISESGTTRGGAIWTNKDLNIIADNGTSVFQGNYVQIGDGEKDYQAIWVDGASTNLNLKQVNNGKMYMYDNINGTDGYTVNIQGDGTGTLYLYNDIKNANVTVDNTTINTSNGEIHTYNFNSFNIVNSFNFEPDVDLVNEKMDRITSDNVTVTEGAKLNVSKLHLMNDAKKDETKILFADSNLANHVAYTGSKFVSYSPIYKYETKYILEPDEEGNPLGKFVFLRGAAGGNQSENFNPSVLATPVATAAGVYTTQLQTFNQSFQHSDSYMAMTNSDRIAYKNANRYADEGISDVNVFSPIMTSSQDRGFWVKPYATFERVPLKNGPKVSSISYGTLIGYDTPLTPIKHGFERVMTYYIGYNGASQSYKGIDGYQNGGMLGATMTLYKGNFFNATTISVGANVGEASTMYGHDYYTSLLSGIGNKTGYNFEFRGKLGNKLGTTFVLQPNFFIGYTFINTFDYTNKAGVRIDSDPMSIIQIAPGVKFIANTKRGWQPYLAVNMVWNIFAHNKVMADDVRLPNMSIDPYVQYGIGVQKRFKDRFMAFAQAMLQNGGRNGISLSFGLRWALGK